MSPEPINIHEAKNHLSKLCELAASGQDVLLARYGQPWVRLTALEPAKQVVRYGLLAGDVVISEDFDSRFHENPKEEAPKVEAPGLKEADPPPASLGAAPHVEDDHPASQLNAHDSETSPSMFGDP